MILSPQIYIANPTKTYTFLPLMHTYSLSTILQLDHVLNTLPLDDRLTLPQTYEIERIAVVCYTDHEDDQVLSSTGNHMFCGCLCMLSSSCFERRMDCIPIFMMFI